MGQAILPGDPPIPITLRRSGRARRISLRVSGRDGRVTLSLPAWTPEAEALAFARSKADWLRRMLAAHVPAEVPRIGGLLPVEGVPTPLVAGRVRGVRPGPEGLMTIDDDAIGPRLMAWLKARARDRLAAASDRHAAALGRGYRTLALRDTRSRWGSCAADGRLMFSWRLIMAPPEVLDYVAAHEVAHLAEMNHSAAFWAVVARLKSDYRGPRGWLKANGQALHRWDFR
jgi:predicted metal-dependent hydrolase